MSDFERYIACHTHGRTKWQGHLVCDDCGRVYQTKDKAKPYYASVTYPLSSIRAPGTCICGARLMPPPEIAIGDDPFGKSGHGLFFGKDGIEPMTSPPSGWSGRPICWMCYRKCAKTGYRVPNWVPRRTRPTDN